MERGLSLLCRWLGLAVLFAGAVWTAVRLGAGNWALIPAAALLVALSLYAAGVALGRAAEQDTLLKSLRNRIETLTQEVDQLRAVAEKPAAGETRPEAAVRCPGRPVGRLHCPACGKEQAADRSLFFNCGVRFLFGDDEA